jgi:hypothetical protein
MKPIRHTNSIQGQSFDDADVDVIPTESPHMKTTIGRLLPQQVTSRLSTPPSGGRSGTILRLHLARVVCAVHIQREDLPYSNRKGSNI